jgi:glycosyltransferase involved in cell wall biosynthesis
MNKICYFNLATYSKIGGIENFNKTFLSALDSFNIKITSLSVYDKESKTIYKNIDFKNFNENKVRASMYLLNNIYKVEKLIVAHINLLPIAIIGKVINPKLKIYLSIYGIEVWKKLPYLYRVFLDKIELLSISTYTTNIFIKYNNLVDKQIYYLPPCTNVNIDNRFDNVYEKSEFNILSVARLDSNDSYKGIDSVIKTIPSLIRDIPNLKYTIVGKGDDKERLEQLAKDLKVEKYVEFKGFVECIEPYYQYCDIFALPSRGEGFGIVYIEAMKYKKPCIACDEGGQTDIVIDNKTGFLCRYDDIECLKYKILKLYQNEKMKNEFGENGYKYLVDNFTFDKFKDRLREILND